MAIFPIQLNAPRPAALYKQANGNLDPSQLVDIGPRGKLHVNAARCWKALVAACAAEGLPLTYTYGGTYRSYQDQVTLFLQRHTPAPTVYRYDNGTPVYVRRFWPGRGYYWLKPRMAMAAVPGTSDHGWGLAIDVAFDNDPTDGIGPDDATAITSHPKWTWFAINAAKYGFRWETASEPWHIYLTSADTVPQAVLDWEASVAPVLPPFIPEEGKFSLWPLANKPAVKEGDTGDAVKYLQSVLVFRASQWVPIDGVFDIRTENGVINVQRLFGLAVDGWVGQKTWEAIDYLAGA